MSAEAKRKLEDMNVTDFGILYSAVAPPAMGQPEQMGYYSSDGHSFKADDSELKYLHLPDKTDDLSFDLNVAHELAVGRQPGVQPNMDCLLRWLLLNRSQLTRTTPQRPQFITSRGILTKIMCSPYDQYDGWIIRATRFKGNIYLCRLQTEKEIRESHTDNDQLMRRWGFKFEQYVTSDSPASQPEDPSIPVNEIREFCCMVRTSVGDIPLLISGEVDAIKPECTLQQAQTTGSTGCYVELKTSKVLSHPGHVRTLKRKLVKWWAQSAIIGVPSVVCGFRDEGGIVRSVAQLKTDKMAELATGMWNPAVCLYLLKTFLELASQYAVKDDPRVVYKFEWQPGQRISCQEMTDPEPYRLLPDWYIRQVY